MHYTLSGYLELLGKYIISFNDIKRYFCFFILFEIFITLMVIFSIEYYISLFSIISVFLCFYKIIFCYSYMINDHS